MSNGSQQHWYWIGPPESPFLDRLTDWMTDQVQSKKARSIWQLYPVVNASPQFVSDFLPDADAFVWSIGDAGIADAINLISSTSCTHRSAIQVSVGLVSPQERTRLLEAGVNLHLQHPHHLKAVLDRLHRILPDPIPNSDDRPESG